MKTVITKSSSSGMTDKEHKELMKILYGYPKKRKNLKTERNEKKYSPIY